MDRGRLALIIAALVTAAWFVAFIADFTVRNYDAPPTLHALMMLVAGWAFGQGYIEKKKVDGD